MKCGYGIGEVSYSINIEGLIHKGLLFQNYQSIVDFKTGEIYGYESLMRSSLKIEPEKLLRMAMRQNRLYELDTACIMEGVLSYFSSGCRRESQALFVNVFPSTLLNPSFVPFLDKLRGKVDVPASSIVFEINEAKEEEEIWEVMELKQIVSVLRNEGFRIAMDDVGEGAAGLKKIVEFEPDIIKMSRYFALNLSFSEKKQRLLKMFADYCGKETVMILEGIETMEDSVCAKHLGVTLGQGYFWGVPAKIV
jgi:EAL domain-containing protein (putative c-di-GMP-specific phosphodiesterase class I)